MRELLRNEARAVRAPIYVILTTRAVDLHSFFADLDPVVLLDADPDPAA